MNPLPPLRSNRPAGSQAGQAAAPAAGAAPTRSYGSVLDAAGLHPDARALLQDLLDLPLVEPQSVRDFLVKSADRLAGLTTRERAGHALVHAGLITPYQRDRVVGGSTFGLVLGSYRVLDRIGGGSAGVVFLGEHVLLRRRVAVKVLPADDTVPAEAVERFRGEMRALAALDHPHVVTAYDAGVLASPGRGEPTLHYVVLELVRGGDVEQYVYDHGPQPAERACEWARQTAAGLSAAHDGHLVHRDLKPSNLLLTADRRVKVVDFGLARQLTSTLTRPRTLLGSIEFMAPEQSLDPTAVGPPADVYGLGATLFWVLTGKLPLPRQPNVAEAVRALATGTPYRLREFRPEAPEALERLVARMLARDPAARPTAAEAMDELVPFTAAAAEADPAAARFEVVRLREAGRQLKASARAKDDAVKKAQGAVLFALAKMAESHDGKGDGHARRMREYVRALVGQLAAHPSWAVLSDGNYVAELLRCVGLHDIGKVFVPDAVLGKPGPLTPEERAAVERHPLAGVAVLDALAREHGQSLTFLSVAWAVVRSHHERWDGTGYPDRLAGEHIHPAARLVAPADVYDALRRDRPDRPGLPHAQAVIAILGSHGQFDPTVLAAFRACEKKFEEVYLTIPD